MLENYFHIKCCNSRFLSQFYKYFSSENLISWEIDTWFILFLHTKPLFLCQYISKLYKVLSIYIFGWDMDSVRKKKTLEYIYPNIPWMVVKIEHPRKPKSILRLESAANNHTVVRTIKNCSKNFLQIKCRQKSFLAGLGVLITVKLLFRGSEVPCSSLAVVDFPHLKSRPN